MTQDPNNPKHWIADEGMMFVRIVSQEKYGEEIFLGYTYYIGGVIQIPPHEDLITDFEEKPKDYELTTE